MSVVSLVASRPAVYRVEEIMVELNEILSYMQSDNDDTVVAYAGELSAILERMNDAVASLRSDT